MHPRQMRETVTPVAPRSVYCMRASRLRGRESATSGGIMANETTVTAAESGVFALGGDLHVHRLGFGAMRITGRGIFGPPADRGEAVRVLRRAMELGVNLIDTAESYGPHVSE